MRNLNLDISKFSSAQISAFFDKCKIKTLSLTIDSYGENIKSYSTGNEIACSVAVLGGNKKFTDETVQNINEITIQVPITTTVTASDNILITNRNGTACNDEYSIIGIEKNFGILLIKAKKIVV